MSIRVVTASALRYVGREDLAESAENGTIPSGEGGEVIKTMLYCVNAAEAELASYYLPLIGVENVRAPNGNFAITIFRHYPYKILKVKKNGREIAFELKEKTVECEPGELEVTYSYVPLAKTLDGGSEYEFCNNGTVSALGAAAEYCLLCGEAALAEVWEERYRREIENIRKSKRDPYYIPPRRWV